MEVESTVEEQPADSLTAELAAQFDKFEAEDIGGVDEVAETETKDPVEGGEAVKAEDEPLEAPQHWSAVDKERFAALDRTGQEFLLRRHDDLEKAFYKKSEDIADIRKSHDSWEPVRSIFEKHPNINPVTTVQNWANIAQSLDRNPRETLLQLAQQYNVQLAQEDDSFIDPKVKTLEERLASQSKTIQELQNSVMRDYETRTNSEKQQVINTIKEFSEQKTEAGDLAHPYFDELYPDMMLLAKGYRADGQQPKLEQLYEQAIRINRDISARIDSDQQKASEKKAEAAAIAKAKKAKLAAQSNPGGSGAISPSDDLSLREMLEKQLG